MSNFENLILRGTRGAQPSASIPGRVYFVTNEKVLERDSGTAWEDISVAGSNTGSSGGATELLAYKANTVGDYTSLTTGTFADIDAANMSVTFTAPASGNVLVRLSASGSGGTTTDGILYWGLREGASNIAGGSSNGGSVAFRNPHVTAFHLFMSATKVFVLTGISAGSHTYKWSYKQSAGAGYVCSDSESPAVMEVWALP